MPAGFLFAKKQVWEVTFVKQLSIKKARDTRLALRISARLLLWKRRFFEGWLGDAEMTRDEEPTFRLRGLTPT